MWLGTTNCSDGGAQEKVAGACGCSPKKIDVDIGRHGYLLSGSWTHLNQLDSSATTSALARQPLASLPF